MEYRGQKGRIREAAIKETESRQRSGWVSYVFRPPRVESWRACRGGLEVAGKDGGGVFWAAFKGVRVDLFKGASEESVKISIVF